MPLPPDHQMVTAADAGPGAPFTGIECPSDDASAEAADIRRVAATCLANTAAFPNTTITFTKGIVVTNSVANGNAILATGNGTGSGITATGGATNGIGGSFLGGATNGRGVEATGVGTGFGASILGGSNGPGAQISAGGGNNTALYVYAAGSGYAIKAQDGNIQLNGTPPTASADPGQHALSSAHYSKAWAKIELDGAGNYTIHDNINVAAVTVAATYVEVTWARAFANAHYAPIVTPNGTAIDVIVPNVNFAAQTTAKTRIFFTQLFGGVAAINPSTYPMSFAIDVKGRD